MKKNIITVNEVGNTTTFQIAGNNGDMIINGSHDSDSQITSFNGISYNNAFLKILGNPLCDLLIRAINNRTIERNYFRLYSELSDNIISEEEFNQEIEDHEDDYVISNNIHPSKDDVLLVTSIINKIKDVQSSEDISSLFSFNSIEVDKILLTIEE